MTKSEFLLARQRFQREAVFLALSWLGLWGFPIAGLVWLGLPDQARAWFQQHPNLAFLWWCWA